jgi:hypothetical protein
MAREVLVELIRNGRVVEHVPIQAAHRQSVHVGDVVMIVAGKHAGRTVKVAGRLDLAGGDTRWSVMRDDGVVMGQYPPEALAILVEGS